MKGSVEIVVKDVEIIDVLCVRTIKMLCYSTCVELSGVFIKAGLKLSAGYGFQCITFSGLCLGEAVSVYFPL